ncbi:MAG: ABC transporter substrate-binding protein [Betaproteobacteria bacterium]|nr:ABC transporter substrate-binding protein [Betaproteobacteria bacterium]
MISTGRRAAMVAALAAAAHAGPAGAQSGPVKIGILNDQAGAYASISGAGSVVAARLAIEDAGGQVLGKPVELVVADHGHKPDIGSSLARRWFDTEGVLAIFDIYSSGVALAVQKIATDKNRILVASTASSREISGKSCSPNGMQWGNDGYSVANLVIKGASGSQPNTWFFLTVDYTAGHSIEADSRKMIEAAGGKVLGGVRFPLGSADFSSFLLQAQASKARNIALVGGGADFTNSAKQASEFRIRESGQVFTPFSLTTEDIYALGSKVVAGMPVVQSFYWDESDASRAWTERFRKAFNGRMPTDPQANVYSAVLHYLKAVKAAGTTDTAAVLAKMKDTPVNDFFTRNARIRADGRLMREMTYGVAKAPEQMKGKDDIVSIVRRYSAEDSFIPAALSECPLLRR